MKKQSKIFILAIFLVLICCVSAASAAEIDDSTADSVSVSESVGEVDEDTALASVDEVNVDDKLMDGESGNENVSDNSRVIYVDQNKAIGDGNGTFENPFSTIALACSNVSGEDKITLNIYNGTYYLGSELKFNTDNLIINGIGEVIIKSSNQKKPLESIELTSSSSNFTINNIVFDASDHTRGIFINTRNPQNSKGFLPFYGDADLGIYNNCSFIGFETTEITGYYRYNSKFYNCLFDGFNGDSSTLLFYDSLSTDISEGFTLFENCIFLNINVPFVGYHDIDKMNCSFIDCWFGQNDFPNFLYPPAYSNGNLVQDYIFPISRYAVFSASENYLGENTYEIIGKLTWNGTEDQNGMEKFNPMIVKLFSDTGNISENTVTLSEGTFKIIYKSNSTEHKVNVLLDNEEIPLSFNTINITAIAPSIKYGQDQNISISLNQPINSNILITVNNKTYSIEVNNSDSFNFTIPDVLKEGYYDINIILNDLEKGLFGINSTTLAVSKVSDYTFDVSAGDVKVGDNATISITLPDDVNGTVIVRFGNDTKELAANQTMTVNFTNLNATTYGVNVSYSGNDKYVALNKSASVTVNKADSVLEIEDVAFTYGEVIAIPFNVTNANGVTVSVLNKDNDEVATASSESGTINLDALPAGKYTLEATTIVGSNYEWVSKTIDLTINKANSSLIIQDKEFAYAAEAVINAVTINSTGDVIATLTDENNTEIAVTVSGDNITLPKLNTGKYTLTVTTNPDENHTNITKTATITINKANPSMNVIVEPVENITTKDDVTLTISLPSDATGEVTVKINGKKADTISANETITVDLNNKVGDYVVDVAYSGDKNYESDMATKEYTVSKAEILITAKQIDFEEGNASKIEVTVPYVESGIVLVDVAGKKFYGDINGSKAIVTIEGVAEGNYTADVKFFGDDKYKEATTTADVKVSEAKIITELKEQLKEAQDNATDLAGQLQDAKDNATDLAGQLQDAKDNATDLAGQLQDAKDNATQLKDELNNVSEQLVDAKNNATQLNNELSDANKKVENLTSELANALNVEKLGSQFNVTEGTTFETYAVETAIGEKGALYAFVLRDSNGNPIANATVTFAYKTVVFNSTTDENGTLYLGISTYLAQDALCAMSYVGDETHNATFVAFNFKIQKKTTAIKAAAKTYKVSKKNKYLTVTLKTIKGASRDGKIYLKKGKLIKLTVNGKTYKGYTDANGKVTFKITNLNKKGKYTAVIKFAGSDTYTGAKTKVKLKVK